MDETSLREQLERALEAEPPLGQLVDKSLCAGRKLRRQRRVASAVAAAAAVGLIAAIVPAAHGSLAGRQHHQQQPSAPRRAPKLTTAYAASVLGSVVPVDLATNAASAPIKIPQPSFSSLETTAAATPNGRTVYELAMTGGVGATVTPIDTATNTAGPTIALNGLEDTGIAVAPDGTTAYVSTDSGVVPISTATNTAGKLINTGRSGSWAMAFTPNGKTLYAVNPFGGPRAAPTVTPIRTATNTALRPIKIPVLAKTDNVLTNIAVTPNGKTAYVADGVYQGKPYVSSVIPIRVATNRALAPIAIEASGQALGLVIAPDGQTAYVLSSRAVTPIDIATNQAEPAIILPDSAGYAYRMALTPNGKTIYVLTPRGVVPIRAASRTVLPRINVPKLALFTVLAITPDGRTIYVGASTTRSRRWHRRKLRVVVGGGVVPISTATNTAGRFIDLGATAASITFAEVRESEAEVPPRSRCPGLSCPDVELGAARMLLQVRISGQDQRGLVARLEVVPGERQG